jgi:hypothetical protein
MPIVQVQRLPVKFPKLTLNVLAFIGRQFPTIEPVRSSRI